MNTTDRFVRFAGEGEVMAKVSRNLKVWRSLGFAVPLRQDSKLHPRARARRDGC
jgi:hypothetical protein